MAVITIARQYGSSGDEVARRVSEALGYQYFDKRMIWQVVSWKHLTVDQLMNYHEDSYPTRTLFDRLRGYRPLPGGLPFADRPRYEGAVDAADQIGENMLVWLTDAAIRLAYDEGDVVILGRCGQIVLHDRPGVLHVRIVAPPEQRAQWAAGHENLSFHHARQTVARHDAAAAEYVKRYYDADWTDAGWYHLVLNTGCWTVDEAAVLIREAAQRLTVTLQREGAPGSEQVAPEESNLDGSATPQL